MLLRWFLVVPSCVLALSCGSSNKAPTVKPGAPSGSGGDAFGFSPGDVEGFQPPEEAEDASIDHWGGLPEPPDGGKPATDGGTVGYKDDADLVCGHGTIFGIICSKNDQAFVNAADVWIDTLDCDGKALHLATVSDDGGYYTLKDVPSGLQTIHVKKGAFENQYNVLVKDGMLSDVTGVGHKECWQVKDVCPVGGIFGYVCHEDGSPFGAGADVQAEGSDCDGNPTTLTTSTDANGNWFLSNLHAGPWKVKVAAADEVLTYDIDVKEGKVEDLQGLGFENCVQDQECGLGVVTGYVCAPDAAYFIGGATVSVSTTDCEGFAFQASTTTDANGNYTLTGVPSGPVTIVVKKDALQTSYQVVVPAGGTVNAPSVVADVCFPAQCLPGQITGYVCAPGKDAFIGGAKVWVDTVDCDGQPVHLETFSDGNGVYVLTNVPPGMQLVHVEKGPLQKQYNVQVVGGQTSKAEDVVSDLCFPPGQDQCGSGQVTGYVCAPNGSDKIGGAHVFIEAVDCKGNAVYIDTFSDENGNFVLDGVPAGSVLVVVEKGSFKTSYAVTVPDGGSVHAPDVVQDACFKKSETKIAVVTGHWDQIELILTQLGLKYDLYDGVWLTNQAIELLTNPQKMAEYDIIFFDCGANHYDILSFNTNAIVQNLYTFVQNGGSIYASDWAFVYAEWPWPNAIDFYGGNQDNFAPKVGDAGELQGTVVDGGLAGFLGKADVTINYNLGIWVVVSGVAPTTTVHITGFVPQAGPNSPLMMSHVEGDGKVLYTTFHNEQQVTGDMINILKYLVFEL